MSGSSSDSRLSLVVDGGGTKTDCCIIRGSGEVVGRGRAGGSNPSTVGVERAVKSIAAAVHEAIAASPSLEPDRQFDRAAFALAGALDEEVRLVMENRLAGLGIARACRVFPDVLPIVLAASPEGAGAALIAGTGSVAAARHHDGRLAVTGGWGYLLGDEGSGYYIGREATRHALRQLESGAPFSPLAQEVQAALHATTIVEIKRELYQHDDPRRWLASLAELVLEADKSGDATAQEIVTDAAAHLVNLLAQAVSQFDSPPDPLSIAIAGGLMAERSPLRKLVETKINEQFPGAQLQQVDDPLLACQRLVEDDCFESANRG